MTRVKQTSSAEDRGELGLEEKSDVKLIDRMWWLSQDAGLKKGEK